MEENLDEISIGHDKLRDKVHVPVSVVSKLLRRLLTRSKHLPQVGDVQ